MVVNEGPIKKKQKRIISHKKNKNPNNPNSKEFPANLPVSDYVTTQEEEFKKQQDK